MFIYFYLITAISHLALGFVSFIKNQRFLGILFTIIASFFIGKFIIGA